MVFIIYQLGIIIRLKNGHMVTQQLTSIEYCSILINCAQMVLRLSHNEIKEGYSDNAMYVMEYIETGTKEDIIDILFDDPQATLSCTFSENSICNASYIFLDNQDEVNNYISYLNKTYSYDFIRNYWVLSDSFLSVKETKDDVCSVSFF